MRAHAGRQRYSGHRLHGSPRALPVERPFPITVIAWFQFAKAWFLLMVVMVGRFAPEAMYRFPTLPAFVFVAAHGRDTHGYLLPAIGVYSAVVGWGLWRLKPWARRSLVVSTGLLLAIWAERFFVDWKAGVAMFKSPLEQESVYFLVFLDAVVFLYLVCYDGVPEAFAVAE